MKTVLNRRDLYLIERIMWKLVKPSELPATVSVESCSGGLTYTAFSNNAVLTITAPCDDDVKPSTLPWTIIKEFAAKKNDYIDLDVNDEDVTLSWSVKGISQTKTIVSLGSTDKLLPPLPESTTAHSFKLFDALLDAGRCVDADNKRYSLGGICFRGEKSQILSTDGRQALIQDGFSFPFDDDVLCPVSKIFASKELREIGDSIEFGATDEWVYFKVANVDFWLRKVDGRFPKFDQFTENVDGHTWLHLDSTDTTFLAERLDALPGKDGKDDAVYIALNDGVAVCGHDTSMKTATELRLANSHYEGSNVVTPLNRKFLKNVLNFGTNRIGFNPTDRTPLICSGDDKLFIVMPLEGDEPVIADDKLTVLMSNAETSVPSNIDKPVKVSKPVPTTQACRAAKPRVKKATKSKGKINAKPNGKVVILDDALRLRNNLRDTLGSVNDLIRLLKSQHRHDKCLRDAVASLRKFQNI